MGSCLLKLLSKNIKTFGKKNIKNNNIKLKEMGIVTFFYIIINRKHVSTKFIYIYIFFLSGFSFTDTDDSRDRRGREGTIFYSTLPLPPAHGHSHIYLQLYMWDDYQVFLIATLVFTRLLLDQTYHLVGSPIDWLVYDVCLFTRWFDFKFLLQQFDTGNRWIWTRIDDHPCIKM